MAKFNFTSPAMFAEGDTDGYWIISLRKNGEVYFDRAGHGVEKLKDAVIEAGQYSARESKDRGTLVANYDLARIALALYTDQNFDYLPAIPDDASDDMITAGTVMVLMTVGAIM